DGQGVLIVLTELRTAVKGEHVTRSPPGGARVIPGDGERANRVEIAESRIPPPTTPGALERPRRVHVPHVSDVPSDVRAPAGREGLSVSDAAHVRVPRDGGPERLEGEAWNEGVDVRAGEGAEHLQVRLLDRP